MTQKKFIVDSGLSIAGSGGDITGVINLTADNILVANVISTPTSDSSVVIQSVETFQPWWYTLYGDIGSELNDDYGESVAYDPAGNVYICGGDGNLGVISFLVKFNSAGVLQWQKTFDLSGHYKSAESVVCDSLGNVYVSIGDYNNGNIYVVKLDTSGNLLWQQELQANYPIIGNMSVDNNDNILLVITNFNNRYTIKFDPAGSILWQIETVGGSGTGIAVDSSNNIYVGEVPITKYDDTGAVIWQNAVSLGNKNNTTCDPAGNVYFAGSSSNPNCSVQKIDNFGNSVWQCDISKGTQIKIPFGIAYDSGNNAVVVMGRYWSGTSDDLYIASIDATTGTMNWINAFGSIADEQLWYFYGTDFINVLGNVLAIVGYSYVASNNNANAVTLQVPTSGQGLGTYGSFSYYNLTGTTETVSEGSVSIDEKVNQPSSIIAVEGTLTVANNTYSSDLVQFFPGGEKTWAFGSNGILTFPDNSTQPTAFSEGGDYTLGNLTLSGLTIDNTRIKLGLNSGFLAQGQYSVAIGNEAGQNNQSPTSIGIGFRAGQTTQGQDSIAIGYGAGGSVQGEYCIAIGSQAGYTNQGQYSVAVGYGAGGTSQSNASVAIGAVAGSYYQGYGTIALGYNSGFQNQGEYSISIGTSAGYTDQGNSAVALGGSAASTNQSAGAVAIGSTAGQNYQGTAAVSIGQSAGQTNQGNYSIAIGYQSGSSGQGAFSLAFGYGAGSTAQANNSIIINATGETLQNTTANAFVVKPIRTVNDITGMYQLYYDPATGEIVYYQP